MSIIPNNARLLVTNATSDDWHDARLMSWPRADYEIHRFGKNDYGVYLKSGALRSLKFRCKCSYLEAERRLAIYLVIRRLLS